MRPDPIARAAPLPCSRLPYRAPAPALLLLLLLLPLPDTTRVPPPFYHSYGVHNQELVASMRYKLDNSTVTPEINIATQHWKVELAHKISNQDSLEATLEKGDDPRLCVCPPA